MSEPRELEHRVAALEARVEYIAAETSTAVSDAAAARHLAAARDRDLADLTAHVDANRTMINAVGEQLSARITDLRAHVDRHFARVDQQFAKMDERFVSMDEQFAKVDQRFARVDEQFAKVDQQFARVDEQFAKVDQQFARMDQQFAKVDQQFEQVDENFVGIGTRLDVAAVGQQTIVDMLTILIEDRRPDA